MVLGYGTKLDGNRWQWHGKTQGEGACDRMANLVDKLDNDELQNLVEGLDLVNAAHKILQRPILISMDQHHERVALARWILQYDTIK